MHNALAMNVVNSLNQLLGVVVHDLGLHGACLLNDIEEGAIGRQVCDQGADLGLVSTGITPSGTFNDLVKFDDV